MQEHVRSHKISEAQELEVVAMYETVECTKPVAEAFGVSDETVRRILKRHGVPRTHRHPKPANEALKRTTNCNKKYCWPSVEMLRRNTGMRFMEISEFTGIPWNSVNNVISKRCADTIEHRDYSHIDIDEIEREYLAGATTYELGERYGVYHATISKWMINRGIRRGKPGRGWEQTRVCGMCGREFAASVPNEKFCDLCKEDAERMQTAKRKRMRYALKHGAPEAEGIGWRDLMERDHGICQICGMPVDINDRRWGDSGPLYPSQDHIVPLAKGGADTMENSQLAHVICNSVKNASDMSEEVARDAQEQAAAYQLPRVDRVGVA